VPAARIAGTPPRNPTALTGLNFHVLVKCLLSVSLKRGSRLHSCRCMHVAMPRGAHANPPPRAAVGCGSRVLWVHGRSQIAEKVASRFLFLLRLGSLFFFLSCLTDGFDALFSRHTTQWHCGPHIVRMGVVSKWPNAPTKATKLRLSYPSSQRGVCMPLCIPRITCFGTLASFPLGFLPVRCALRRQHAPKLP